MTSMKNVKNVENIGRGILVATCVCGERVSMNKFDKDFQHSIETKTDKGYSIYSFSSECANK